MRYIVACSMIYYSSDEQTIHGATLNDDYFRVSMDELIKAVTFLPIQACEHKTLRDAFSSFVG